MSNWFTQKSRFLNGFKVFAYLPLILIHAGCKDKEKQSLEFGNKDVNKLINVITEIMVHDVTSPPLAARFYSYICLSGYEVLAFENNNLKSMHGILNDFPVVSRPLIPHSVNHQFAALLAMMETVKKMLPSGKSIEYYENSFIDSCKRIGLSNKIIDSSVSYALEVSKAIQAYAKADKYNALSNNPKYTPKKGDSSWYPTPPGFFAAVEPYFHSIRPFTFSHASQLKPNLPTVFSSKKGTAFYRMAEDAYNESKVTTVNNIALAAFWDCNPFALSDNGHLLIGVKKISPGAHWLGITGIACSKSNKSFEQTVEVFTAVSIGLADAFISCWDEKYRSNRIRPETYIRKYIDPNWQPLLQTPPFPEYPSGHSVISQTSATILTHFFGENYSYTDDVEVKYGLQPMAFSSFYEAARQAAISRFYGGIHFKDAIVNGTMQGTQIGRFVLNKLKYETQ